ncbi:hypothetical protein QCA50_021188 [Cerrena zonata]|uniref:Uncharacterized protein n=1 Tax=Cerrena zonata TaxID=2478898 RepID=A0AAW0F768_9APHY
MEEEEEEEEGSQSEEEVNKTFTPTTVLGNNNNLINQLQKQQKNQNITPLSSPNKTTPPTPRSNSPVTSKQNDRPAQHEKKPSLGQISHSSTPSLSVKKPVIRGRKVGELAKLYEERCQGIELLRKRIHLQK